MLVRKLCVCAHARARACMCSGSVSNLGELQQLNMYLNDLNMYDNSRDLVLQGHNHAPLLESLMEQVPYSLFSRNHVFLYRTLVKLCVWLEKHWSPKCIYHWNSFCDIVKRIFVCLFVCLFFCFFLGGSRAKMVCFPTVI